ncbi:MAG: hypothetical protein CSA26_05165 [Desulfobacterales bacterium]|nr:MAG: hypothetical protein CSA26_05165 [Desulfobacterales bacterium]
MINKTSTKKMARQGGSQYHISISFNMKTFFLYKFSQKINSLNVIKLTVFILTKTIYIWWTSI